VTGPSETLGGEALFVETPLELLRPVWRWKFDFFSFCDTCTPLFSGSYPFYLILLVFFSLGFATGAALPRQGHTSILFEGSPPLAFRPSYKNGPIFPTSFVRTNCPPFFLPSTFFAPAAACFDHPLILNTLDICPLRPRCSFKLAAGRASQKPPLRWVSERPLTT